jgi:DNA repair exonuclease SbcCD nuclease subunit
MKFAHISDCHLGAWQHNEELCELNLQAFLIALDICLTKKVKSYVSQG